MSSPTSDHVRAEIRALLARLARGSAFTDDIDVFAASIVRSMNLLELIVAIEDAYNITVTQRDVFEGHLRSVDRLVPFVLARVSAAA